MNLTQDELQTLINLVDARLERQYNEEYQTILDKLTEFQWRSLWIKTTKTNLKNLVMTQNELNELRYHYVDRLVDNMSTKDLVQYVFDDMTQYVDNQSDTEFLEDCRNYWEEYYDDVVKDIKEYANSKVKKPIEDREASNFFINTKQFELNHISNGEED